MFKTVEVKLRKNIDFYFSNFIEVMKDNEESDVNQLVVASSIYALVCMALSIPEQEMLDQVSAQRANFEKLLIKNGVYKDGNN